MLDDLWDLNLHIQTLPCPILAVFSPQSLVKEEFQVPEVKVISSASEEPNLENRESKPSVLSQHGRSLQAKGPPPWRDSDRHPTDTIRFNYLDNLDPIEHTRQV